MSAELASGSTFAGYRVEALLGRGGMGLVYRATDLGLERPVALKLIAPELAQDERFRERFLRESRLAASLDHPHVVPIYEAREAGGSLYIAMRYVEGADLKALLAREGRLEPARALAVLAQVADALDAAHAKGLVHRDVKPGNVLVDGAGHAYLTDFGLSKQAASGSLTGSGRLIGTLDYLAPEQIRGESLDGRSDQYALACLLYECLTGKPPFRRETEAETLWAQMQEQPPPLAEPPLDPVLSKGLAKAKEDRYQSCSALVQAAREALTSGVTPRPLRNGPVFVGRERELGELLAGLEDAIVGRGRLFLISGEPGIGKSRLADELLSRARARGSRTLVGRSWEAGGAPAYWPWVQALRAYLQDGDPESLRPQLGKGASELAQILPELRELFPDLPVPPSLDPESARFRLFEAVATFLRGAAQAQPLMLVLDDLHAADEPSLLMLRFVAAELAGARILVLGAFRDVDPTLRDPLSSALAELTREPVTRRLSLSGLEEDDVANFIELSAAVEPPRSLVAAIHRETEGNPLFVGEVVRLLEAEGRLADVQDETAWRLAVPEGVRAVIGRRLGRLSAECGRVLALASVIGRELGVEALARVSELSSDELLEVLDEAIVERVVTEVPGTPGRLRFTHALIRDTLYDELATGRRLRLHRQIGEVLEALYAGNPEPHLAELAHHFFEAAPAGGVDKAIDYARRAGDRAIALLAYEEAVRLYRGALEALVLKDAGDEETRCELLVALGDAQTRAGDEPAAKATFLEAAEASRALGAAELLARAALGYGGRFLWARAGTDPHIVGLLRDALGSLGNEDSTLRVKVLTRLAGALRDQHEREPRAALSAEAVEMARRLGDPATLAYALEGMWTAIFWPENTDERVAIGEELVGLAEEIGDLERGHQAHYYRAMSQLELGDLAAVEAALERIGRLTDQLRQPAQRWELVVTQATVALFQGRFEEGELLMEEAVALGERAQSSDAVLSYRIQRFTLARERGGLEHVAEDIRRSIDEYPARPMFRCMIACLYADLGREREAREIFGQLAADGFALPLTNEWLFSLGFLAEAAAFLGDVDRGRTLYELLLPYPARNASTADYIATGSVSRPLGILASLTSRWDDAARHFEDALELNTRMGARPWVARTQLDYARLLLAREESGDRDRALELLESCLETCEELGMWPVTEQASALRKQAAAAPAEP